MILLRSNFIYEAIGLVTTKDKELYRLRLVYPQNPTDHWKLNAIFQIKCIIPSRTFFFLRINILSQFCLCQNIFIQLQFLEYKLSLWPEFFCLFFIFKNKLPIHIFERYTFFRFLSFRIELLNRSN